MRAVIFIHVLYLLLIKTFTVKGAGKCESKVELRAVLLSCPVKDSGCDDDDPLTQAMNSEEVQILQTDPGNCERIKEEKSREFPCAVKECKRKLIITLKIKNSGKIPCDDEYIVVDHVFDPLTGGRGRLLSPVVIKLRQEQMVQLYGLQFQRAVNSDPFEEQRPVENGCSIDPKNPSCGIAMYNGKPIPFSEGFCCSCDPHVNAKRQLSLVSQGEDFPYRGSRLSYQGNSRIPYENKANLIYNPELVTLKSGIRNDPARSKASETNEIFDSLFSDNIPNFLLEGDRKIVCDKGDFMKELCLLRDDSKVTAKTDFRKSAGEDFGSGENQVAEGTGVLPFQNDLEVTTVSVDSDAPQVPNSNLEKNAVELQNFIKSLSVDHPPNSDTLGTKGIRGKRENPDNKKLSLEEKLNRFATSRSWVLGRRKRLMEISHKRFRKSEERRSQAEVSKLSSDNVNSPPRYFFSHDRAIIDPLESLDPRANATCQFKESVCEFPSREQDFAKVQNCGKFKDKEVEIDPSFYMLPNNADKTLRKENYFGGNVGFKKDNLNIEAGKQETGDRKLEKGLEEEEEEEEGKLKDGYGSKFFGGEQNKEQTSQFHAKGLKHLLHKTDREKLKLRNLFTARNKDKDKSEFNKHKMGESGQQLASDVSKCKNELDGRANKVAESSAGVKAKEEKSMKEQNNEENFLEVNTGKMNDMNQQTTGQLEKQSSMSKDPGKRYQKPTLSRAQHPESQTGNVDFKIKIVRNKAPEMNQRKFYSMFPELAGKTGVDFTPNRYGSNAYPAVGKAQDYQQNPFLPYMSPQKLPLHDRQKKLPETYVVRSSSMLQNRGRYLKETRKDPMDPKEGKTMKDGSTFRHRKPIREHLPPVDDYLDENTFSARWSDGLRDIHSRGKRYSEAATQKAENPESEQSQDLYCEKSRKKRSAAFAFQPAKGFFESELDSPREEGLFIHELETCEKRRSCPRVKHENFSDTIPSPNLGKRKAKLPSDKERLMQSYLNAPDYVLQEVENLVKGKRESSDNGKKFRVMAEGPAFECADPQDTMHCMRLGDLWYSLYSIKKPMISQIVGIQLFDKHTVGEGTEWRELTKGKMIRIGTFITKAEDELPSISVTYSGERTGRCKNTIDPDNYFLLIPSHVSEASKASFYPQLDGGPSEYLLVPVKDTSSGGECNRIGTSFEAFARQPDRCSQRQGSCLKRQPVDLWREDMEARIRGKRGRYFVENFGTVPNSPIKSYTNLTGEFLALEYYGEYTSTIEIEVKADSNAIIRKGSIAQIPLVYIDSTYSKKTRIILSILNSGLTSSNFRPRLGDCPPDLDVAWCPLEGPLVTIPPHQRHDFKLDISGALPSKEIFLTVQVLSQINKEVALRRILIKREHRCLCAFHCKCNCVGNSKDGRTCHKLSLEEYRRAGFVGTYPFRGGAAAYAASSGSIWKYIHTILVTAACILLLLGVLKGILGLFIRRLGIAGVRVITGPRQLSAYYESELKGCSVLCDECGFPIHPTTCRPVQIVPLCFEMILNFIFFFLYPLRGLWFLIVSLACCSSLYSDCDSCCRREEAERDRKSSRPLLAKEPDPTYVHYNLTAVNPKKSKQEYLPYPAYKGDDDPLEEDDTEFVLQEMKRYRKK